MSLIIIALNGVNNIGKTTQMNLLEEYLMKSGHNVKRVKFPVYDLGERGPFIHKYFHDPVFRAEYNSAHPGTTEADISRITIENRRDFEATLHAWHDTCDIVLMESGRLDSMAWSLLFGIPESEVWDLHLRLTPEHINVLLNETSGRRFLEAKTRGHMNEDSDARISRARENMLVLREDGRLKVTTVDFTLEETREAIHARIVEAITPSLES